MNHRIEELLLGHILKANDPASQAELERLVTCNPRTRHTVEVLKSSFAPLEADREEVPPPCDLWIRTIARVAEHMVAAEGPPSQTGEPPVFGKILNQHVNNCHAAPPAESTASSALMPASDPEITLPRRWNVFTAIGLTVAGVALLFPAIVHVRQHNERMVCQDSMKRFHQAATSYADRNEGRLPQIEDGEKVARIITLLEETGSLGQNERFACVAAPIPMGNSPFANYSYTLGYRDNHGELRGVILGHDPAILPLLADAPSRTGPSVASDNHRHGQNVLFLDGNVRFCSHVNVGIDQDNIFVNDKGMVGAGLRPADTVLGRPEERP